MDACLDRNEVYLLSQIHETRHLILQERNLSDIDSNMMSTRHLPLRFRFPCDRKQREKHLENVD